MKQVPSLTTVAATAAINEMKRRYQSRSKLRKRVKRAVSTKRKRGRSTTKTTTRRTRRRVYQNHATENREIALRLAARRMPLRRMVAAGYEPSWHRFQNVSQYDTSVGALCIAQRFNSTTGLRYPPCHIYDITSCPNVVDNALSYPSPGFALTQTPAGACDVQALSGQNASGTVVAPGQWYFENTGVDPAAGAAASPFDAPVRKGIHEHTTLQLNLYGVRKRATKWMVDLIMVNEEFADFLSADANNVQKKKLYDFLCRPFIYSNLLSAEPQTQTYFKTLRRYSVTIAPTTTDEYGGATAVPHIQTVRWFLRHNRLRRFDWMREAPTAGLTPAAAWDNQTGSVDSTRVRPKYRLYLVLRAMSPEAVTSTTATPMVAADPISEPSYDIVLRNKWQFAT